MQTPAFWLAVGKIIWINVLLSGDNALVIALACQGLHPRQRVWGMVIGAGIAVVLRGLPFLEVGPVAFVVDVGTQVPGPVGEGEQGPRVPEPLARYPDCGD